MIQDTSLEIYLKKVYPNLNARQRVVLHYLRNVGTARTNEEILTALGVPINHITGRANELVKKGLVVDVGRRRCEVTGHNVHAWKVKHPGLPPAFKPSPPTDFQQLLLRSKDATLDTERSIENYTALQISAIG